MRLYDVYDRLRGWKFVFLSIKIEQRNDIIIHLLMYRDVVDGRQKAPGFTTLFFQLPSRSHTYT